MAKKKYKSYIMLGYDERGKEIRKYCSASTAIGLERRKIELRRQYLQGELSIKNALVRDLAKSWLETKKMRARSTYEMYESVLRLHIIPIIGHMKLNDVKNIHIQQCINALVDRPRTAVKVKNTLKQLFDVALASDYVQKNPVINLEVPTHRTRRKRALTDIEKIALKRADLTLEQRVLVGLMMRCGMANNEVAGLRRRDIDLIEKRINVRGVVDLEMPPKQRNSFMSAYKPYPKTESRVRSLPIPDDLFRHLKEFCSKTVDFLFLTKEGSLLTRSSFFARWQAIINQWNQAAGGKAHTDPKSKRLVVDHWSIGKDITPYFLRHEYATELMRSGYTLPEAMYLMGHSTRKMLLEVYAHVESVKITADKLNGGLPEVLRKKQLNKSDREKKKPPEHRNVSGFYWCPESESNQRHVDFQSTALPTELSGQNTAGYSSRQ